MVLAPWEDNKISDLTEQIVHTDGEQIVHTDGHMKSEEPSVASKLLTANLLTNHCLTSR